MGHVGPLGENLTSFVSLGIAEILGFSELSIYSEVVLKPFYNTLNYASTANIEEVMKFYNQGGKTFETDFNFIQGVSKCLLKCGEHYIDDFQFIPCCTPLEYVLRKELCMTHFSANLSVFYTVDGLKRDLIIRFNVFKLLCKDHVNINAALN